MKSIDVTIIIVNYNTKKLTIDCIKSIIEFTKDVVYEIIVVDNASIDDTCHEIRKLFPDIKLIESEINLGFGKANNLGATYANGKYLFFLNPDCLLLENSIFKFFNYFETNNYDEKLGVIGCTLIDKFNIMNTSYQKFPTPCRNIRKIIISRLNSLFKTKFIEKGSQNYKLNNSNEVDFITGADLFIPLKIFNKLNGFDPIFFMYFEETDLQKRLSQLSLKRVILNDTNIIHLEGGSNNSKLSTTTLFVDSQFKYIKKHYPIFIYMFYYFMIIPFLLPSVLNKSSSSELKIKFLKVLIKHINPMLK